MYKIGDVRRGQVTILIIVGLIFLFALALFFLVSLPSPTLDTNPTKAPQLFIEECVEAALRPSIQSVLDNGGFSNPRQFIRRNDHEFTYLCFTDSYYSKCYNYYPSLHLIAQEQIRVDSRDRVDDCFTALIDDYESQNFVVEGKPLEYSVEIIPGSIRLRINKEFFTTRDGSSTDSFDDFDQTIPSDLYDLISITRQIVNQEAEYCYFENNGFMILYPNYNITKTSYVESKLYEVENRKTKESFKFAIRSCPSPPGFWAGGVDPEVLDRFNPIDDVRDFRDENDENNEDG